MTETTTIPTPDDAPGNPNVRELGFAATLYWAVLYRMVLLSGNEVKLTASEDVVRATCKKLVQEVKETYNTPHASDDERFNAIMDSVEKFITAQATGQMKGAKKTVKKLIESAPVLVDAQGRKLA